MIKAILFVLAMIAYLATFSTKEGEKVYSWLAIALFTLTVILEIA
ncbi:hypothetical protein G314FT_17370 [Vagococcus luciliae]|uniref:Uncharacterized protein n=1 Tax=Vagococcus luciliae TaxID=2920380 RepID=A0ABY5P1P0_9ENTE|nr:hypothetical protein G314FT_17370 [Vagococcus luciliae]